MLTKQGIFTESCVSFIPVIRYSENNLCGEIAKSNASTIMPIEQWDTKRHKKSTL